MPVTVVPAVSLTVNLKPLEPLLANPLPVWVNFVSFALILIPVLALFSSMVILVLPSSILNLFPEVEGLDNLTSTP